MINPNITSDSRCLEAEQAVVGSAMISDNLIPSLTSYMTPERFFHQQLGAVFEAVITLFNSRLPVDVVSVSHELRRNGNYDPCGGEATIKECLASVAFADHGEHYAKIAASYYYERSIITAAGDVVISVGSQAEDTTEKLEKLRMLVLAREQLGIPSTFDYKNDLHDILDNILKKKTAKRHEVGFPTLDRSFKGISSGEVVTWGAATNMGKSLILTNIMSHCAQRDESVLYVGTEMSSQETVARHLSILSGIEPYKIKLANLSPDEIQKLQSTISDRMFAMSIRILDLSEPSISDVEAALTTQKCDVVFLDYLQRFKLPPGDNYRLQVNDFMRRVKNLARKYDVVVHVASQLSRGAYGPEERRPALSDLSESSSIEKESDRVVLLWAPKEKNKEAASAPGYRILEAFVAKDRHGRRGLAVDLKLDEKTLRITEVATEVEPALYS